MALYSDAIVFLLVGLVQGQGEGGSPDCPCIEWADLDQYIVGDLVTGHLVYAPSGSSGPQYEYPVNYGNAMCKKHDEGLPPMCSRASPPSWCNQRWCYVDTAKCTLRSIKTQFFTGAQKPPYFSYETCTGAGGANSFSKSMASSPDTAMSDLISLMNTNLESVRGQIETSYKQISTSDTKEKCDVPGICPCTTCESHEPWKGRKVDFTEIGAEMASSSAYGADVMNKASCLAKATGDPYRKVAAMESDARGSRVGYQYYADQLTGSYVQWPAIQWCPRGDAGDSGDSEKPWDFRLRPWYASAATGPKDVVLVVDVSGSMGQESRIHKAKRATIEALNTLSWRDFASIVLFDGKVAGIYSELMVPVTERERAAMQAWAENEIYPKGGTSFTAGLWKALKIIQKSVSAGRSAMCEKAILFLTDGQDMNWQEKDYGYVNDECTKRGTILFSYALGSGADTTITKRLACENRGIFYEVEDNAELAPVMAKYYEYFAAGTQDCSPSWVKYKDPTSNEDLYAACSVIRDRTKVNPSLLGASCMDANMVADADTLRKHNKWQEFVCSVSDISKKCRANYLDECHREQLRAAYHESAICGFNTEAVPATCPCLDPSCRDDDDYIDPKGYFCDTFVGDQCTEEALKEWDYSTAEVNEVRSKCKKSCGLCGWLPVDQCSATSTCAPAPSSPPQCRPCTRAKVSGNNIDAKKHCCSSNGEECGKAIGAVGGTSSDPSADGASSCGYQLLTVLTAVLAMSWYQ